MSVAQCVYEQKCPHASRFLSNYGFRQCELPGMAALNQTQIPASAVCVCDHGPHLSSLRQQSLKVY